MVRFSYLQAGGDREIRNGKFTPQKPVIRVFAELRPGAADRDSTADQLVIKFTDGRKWNHTRSGIQISSLDEIKNAADGEGMAAQIPDTLSNIRPS